MSQLALGEVQLKKAREKSVFAHPHIDVFPESPMQLPADAYQHAYIAPEVPHLWSPDLLDRLHMEAPQRKSHRTCQKTTLAIQKMFCKHSTNSLGARRQTQRDLTLSHRQHSRRCRCRVALCRHQCYPNALCRHQCRRRCQCRVSHRCISL